jgi:hypothetical protein
MASTRQAEAHEVADKNLWETFLELFRDDEAQARFREDPAKYLADEGHGDVDAADVQDAATLAWEEVNFGPQSQSGGSTFNSGGNTVNQSGAVGYGASSSAGSYSAPPPCPPPPPADLPPAEAAVYYVTEHNSYVENNSWIDDRDINQDNSINTQVQANGDVDLSIDQDVVSNSGDGSVTGQDIDDVGVVNGDGMAFGDAENANIAVLEGDGTAVANDDGSVNTGTFTGVQESGDGDVTITDAAVGFGDGAVSNTDIGEGAAVGEHATVNEVNVTGNDNAVAVDDSHAATDNDGLDLDLDIGPDIFVDPVSGPMAVEEEGSSEPMKVADFDDPQLAAMEEAAADPDDALED